MTDLTSPKGILRIVLSLVVCFVAVTTARAAEAADKTIAVLIEGPNADAVRSRIVAIVPKTVKVADQGDFEKALSKTGQKGLGPAITAPKQRDKILKNVRKALDASHFDAAILGRARRAKGGGDEVYIVYVDAIPGDLAVDEAVPQKAGNESAALKKTLGPTLDQLAPPPPKEEAPKETPKEETPKEEAKPTETTGKDEGGSSGERKAHKVATEIFEIRAGYELGGRSFDYKDALPENVNMMRSYHVFGAGLLALGADLYPLASTGKKVIRDIGITGDFAHAFGLNSAIKGGDPIPTKYDKFRIALRGRFRTGDEDSPVIGARVGYAGVSFNFNSPPPNLDGTLAGVSYGCLMLGADGRIPFSRLALNLGFDYLAPLSKGDVAGRFVGTSAGGLDLRAGLSLAIAAGFEVRFVADYTRFWYKFAPVPGNTYVAGGALDQLLGLGLGLAYVY